MLFKGKDYTIFPDDSDEDNDDEKENKNYPKTAFDIGYKKSIENVEDEKIDLDEEIENHEITNKNAISAFKKGIEIGETVRIKRLSDKNVEDIGYNDIIFDDDEDEVE